MYESGRCTISDGSAFGNTTWNGLFENTIDRVFGGNRPWSWHPKGFAQHIPVDQTASVHTVSEALFLNTNRKNYT